MLLVSIKLQVLKAKVFQHSLNFCNLLREITGTGL